MMRTLAGLQEWWDRWNFRGEGASSFSGHADWLFFMIYAISTFFFVLLMVLMVWWTFQYRRRPGQAPQRSPGHNTLLELSWSVIPTILLVWMFFEGFWGYADQLVAPSEAPELVVEGRQWSWALTYPNGAISPETTRSRHMAGSKDTFLAGHSAVKNGRIVEGVQDTPIFVIPEGKPVRLRMSSIDVIHSFWVPDFRAKFDVFPNRYTSVWFQPTEIHGGATLPAEGGWKAWAGTPYEDHWVFCAEYCGSNHSEMSAVLRVVPADVYARIIEDWATPRGAPWEIGKFLYKSKGCNACHSVDGSKNVGPTWKDLYNSDQPITGMGAVKADENYIRESILNPGAKIVQGYPNQMTSYQGKIKDEEINAIIWYMRSISESTSQADKDVIASGVAPGAAGATGATGQTGATGATGSTGPTSTPGGAK